MTYEEKLELLRHHNPAHILLRMLTASRSASSTLILDRLIADIPVKAAPEVQEEEPEDVRDLDDPADVKLAAMRREQSDLFTIRRRLSNSFHDCQNDRQRASVSDQVQEVQRQIDRLFAKIDAYKSLGLDPGKRDEKYPIPEHPGDRVQLQYSLRSSISRKRGQIKDLADQPEKLEKAEAKLRELQNHLKHVEKAIAADLQPG